MMNSKDPVTPGRVMLTVRALVLSLLKVICGRRGQRGGDTLGLGDRRGLGRQGGTGSSQDQWPRNPLHSAGRAPPRRRNLERKVLHSSLPDSPN